MTDASSIHPVKKLATRGLFGGVDFAIGIAILAGAALCYHDGPERPKPWNSTALKASFDAMEISAEQSTFIHTYPVGFYSLKRYSNVCMHALQFRVCVVVAKPRDIGLIPKQRSDLVS